MDVEDIVLSNMILKCATELSWVVLITLVGFVAYSSQFGLFTIISFVEPLGHTCFTDINANGHSGEDQDNYKTHTNTHDTATATALFSGGRTREDL